MSLLSIYNRGAVVEYLNGIKYKKNARNLYCNDSIQRLTYGSSMGHFTDILVDFEQRSFF